MSRPLKIIQLGLRGFPNVQGGVEKHVESLSVALTALGCEVNVIVRQRYMKHVQADTWNGIRYLALWSPKAQHLEAIVHSALGVLLAALIRPDILHIHGIGPALLAPLARLLGLRVVVTHHGPDYDRQKWGIVARMVLRLGEFCGMKYANARIAISRTIAGSIQAKYGIAAHVIHNGATLPSDIATQDTLAKFGLTSRQYVLLVSRIVPEKRHLDLIKAFEKAELPGWKLVLVGSADHQSAYSAEVATAAAKSNNIIMAGFQSGVALSESFGNAGIFVLPSSHEGLPIVALEALSYGLPIIASNIAANLELPLDSDQYFSVGDVDGLTERLKHFALIPYSSERQCAIRSKLMALYDWSAIGEATLNVYRDVCRRAQVLETESTQVVAGSVEAPRQ